MSFGDWAQKETAPSTILSAWIEVKAPRRFRTGRVSAFFGDRLVVVLIGCGIEWLKSMIGLF
jgi:hypothetical protein